MRQEDIGGYAMKIDQLKDEFDALYTKLQALEEELVDETERYRGPIRTAKERLESSWQAIRRFHYVLLRLQEGR